MNGISLSLKRGVFEFHPMIRTGRYIDEGVLGGGMGLFLIGATGRRFCHKSQNTKGIPKQIPT
jgi:hypothetical protein